jgi:UPF0271 protein
MQMDPAEVEDSLIAQIGALTAIARAEGAAVQHVKAHGALYNMAVRDARLAAAIARAVRLCDSGLILFGLPGSPLLDAGRSEGLRVAAEGFADRSYEPDGSLTPRSRPGAVVHDVESVVARAVRMVRDGVVFTPDGRAVQLAVQTLCVHGDTPGAADLVARIAAALRDGGADLSPIGRWL